MGIVVWAQHCGKETVRCDSGAKPCQHCCKTRASNENTIPLEGIKQRQTVNRAVREKSAFNLLHGRFQHCIQCVLSVWERNHKLFESFPEAIENGQQSDNKLPIAFNSTLMLNFYSS